MTAPSIHDLVGGLVRYPERGYHDALERCRAAARADDPEVAAAMDDLIALTTGESVESLQEMYTRTFDLDPACTLDLGWHIHGEAYQRGEFLVEMRTLLQRAGIEERDELPDHLSHMVVLLGRLPFEEAAGLASRILPAIDKVLSALDGKDNPFAHAVKAVHALIVKRHAPEVGCRG